MGTCWLVYNHCFYYHKDNISVCQNVVTFLPFAIGCQMHGRQGTVLGKVQEEFAKELFVL